ncbi:MAG: AAA family ATPase [Acutalibacteraceae bacterium]
MDVKMINKILICGANGVGKTTFGKALSNATGWKFMDIEDYIFSDNSENPYEPVRTRNEVKALLLEDLTNASNFIFSSVKGNYGEEISSSFTCAVYIEAPKELRSKRVWERSYQKLGDRIIKGGDLYEQEKRFLDMVESRPENDVSEWLKTIAVPVISIDGTKPVYENVKIVLDIIG